MLEGIVSDKENHLLAGVPLAVVIAIVIGFDGRRVGEDTQAQVSVCARKLAIEFFTKWWQEAKKSGLPLILELFSGAGVRLNDWF